MCKGKRAAGYDCPPPLAARPRCRTGCANGSLVQALPREDSSHPYASAEGLVYRTVAASSRLVHGMLKEARGRRYSSAGAEVLRVPAWHWLRKVF